MLQLIDRYLKAGALTDEGLEATVEGTPQGGPLSPLLANLLLDGLDKELERRGHRFVRYADDCNIYVQERTAGQRVLASVTRFLERRLKLTVNEAKSAVDRPWRPDVSGLHVHRATAEPAPGERQGPEGVQRGGAPLTFRTRGGLAAGRGGTAAVTWGGGPTLALPRRSSAAGAGLLDPAAAALLSVEAMGAATVPGTASPRREPGLGLEHGQVRPWAVASAAAARRWRSRSLRATSTAWVCRASIAASHATESTEPPDT